MTATEATETFFTITKLFQSNDITLRRLVYLAIKEMSTISNDVIIVTSRCGLYGYGVVGVNVIIVPILLSV